MFKEVKRAYRHYKRSGDIVDLNPSEIEEVVADWESDFQNGEKISTVFKEELA